MEKFNATDTITWELAQRPEYLLDLKFLAEFLSLFSNPEFQLSLWISLKAYCAESPEPYMRYS
jgi:hypothetical protein